MHKTRLFVLASAAVLIAGPSLAHHTRAHFDRSQAVEVTGKVVEYHLVNPHSWLYMDSTSADGKVRKWAFETNGAVNQLVRQRWTVDVIKPGDMVTATFNPLKDGSSGGLLVSVKLPDGTVLSGE
jgi:hypothetical protein